jgi:hypothetical protein
MTKIVPFTMSEQAEIRRLLRHADLAREINPESLARIERMTLNALASRPQRTMLSRLWQHLSENAPLASWPTAALGAVAAGLLFGNFFAVPLTPAPGDLITVAASEPWQQYAEDTHEYTPGDSP